MKAITLLIILLFSLDLSGQDNNLDCYEFMHYEQNKSFCDTTHFSNGAKMYYLWNCDSTWLTFEKNEKVILKSCPDFEPILCERIGLNLIKEYPNYLLFIHKWASSSSWSPDFVFINKETGHEDKRIVKDLFVWVDSDEDYVLYFSNATFSELVFLDLKLDKEIPFSFDEEEVLNSIVNNKIIQVSGLFKNFKMSKGLCEFDFVNNEGKVERRKMTIQ